MMRHDLGRSKAETKHQRGASTFTFGIVLASTILGVVATFSPRGRSMQESNGNLRPGDPPLPWAAMPVARPAAKECGSISIETERRIPDRIDRAVESRTADASEPGNIASRLQRPDDPPRIYVVGLGTGPGILFTQLPSVGLLRILLDRIRPDVIFTDLTSGFVEQGSPDHYLPYEWSQIAMPYSRERSIPFVPVSSPRDASQSFIQVEFHLIDLCTKWTNAVRARKDVSSQPLGQIEEFARKSPHLNLGGRAPADILTGRPPEGRGTNRDAKPWREAVESLDELERQVKERSPEVAVFLTPYMNVRRMSDAIATRLPGYTCSTIESVIDDLDSSDGTLDLVDLKAILTWRLDSSMSREKGIPLPFDQLVHLTRACGERPGGRRVGSYFFARVVSVINPEFATWLYDEIIATGRDELLCPYPWLEWRARLTLIESAMYESAKLDAARGDAQGTKHLVEDLTHRLKDRLVVTRRAEARGRDVATVLSDPRFQLAANPYRTTRGWTLSSDPAHVTAEYEPDRELDEERVLILRIHDDGANDTQETDVALSQPWSISSQYMLSRGTRVGVWIKVRGQVRGTIAFGDDRTLIDQSTKIALPEDAWFPLSTRKLIEKTGKLVISLTCAPGSEVRIDRVFGDEFEYVPAAIESCLLERCIFESGRLLD